MKKPTNTTNGKATGGQPDGSNKTPTDALDSTGVNPAQTEVTFEFEPEKRVIKKSRYILKSTANEAQYERIDQAYDYAGKLISTLDFRKMGVLHPAGRIKEMNEKLGYNIPTVDQRTVYDDQGFPHPRIAFYELIDRPAQGRRA